DLSIKNVPAEMLVQLRERAERHHRSMQGELMALLQQAIEPQATVGATEIARRPGGTLRIEEIVARNSRRWKKPFDKGPLAVDIIRADRDAR
ncbi:MAG: Arc-like binding domain, partial [Pseudomonadota bacterium]